VSLIRRLNNGKYALMHVSRPKESILNACYDVLFIEFRNVKKTWSAKVTFLRRFDTNTLR